MTEQENDPLLNPLNYELATDLLIRVQDEMTGERISEIWDNPILKIAIGRMILECGLPPNPDIIKLVKAVVILTVAAQEPSETDVLT